MTKEELAQFCPLKREIRQLQGELALAEQRAEAEPLKELLEHRLESCRQQLCCLERYIASVEDSRVRQILTLRYEQGLSWVQVAQRMGGGNSESCVRMTVCRFLKKNQKDKNN